MSFWYQQNPAEHLWDRSGAAGGGEQLLPQETSRRGERVASASSVESKGFRSCGGERFSSVPGRRRGCGSFAVCTASVFLRVLVSELAQHCVPRAGQAWASSSCVLLTLEVPSKKGLRGDRSLEKPERGSEAALWSAAGLRTAVKEGPRRQEAPEDTTGLGSSSSAGGDAGTG